MEEKSQFKSLSKLYEDVYNPISTDRFIYMISHTGTPSSIDMDFAAGSESDIPKLANYYMKEVIMADKVLGIEVNGDRVAVKYDMHGDGDLDVVRLYVHKVKLI